VKVSLVLVDDYDQVIFSVWEFTSSLIFLAWQLIKATFIQTSHGMFVRVSPTFGSSDQRKYYWMIHHFLSLPIFTLSLDPVLSEYFAYANRDIYSQGKWWQSKIHGCKYILVAVSGRALWDWYDLFLLIKNNCCWINDSMLQHQSS
jgi:hypothetical protein